MPHWLTTWQEEKEEDAVLMIVGNKTDLIDDDQVSEAQHPRQVATSDGKRVAEVIQMFVLKFT